MKKPAQRSPKTVDPTAATLAELIKTAPLLSSPDEARERVDTWLADIAKTTAGKNLQRIVKSAPQAQALLVGLADGSPYLWDLASTDPGRLVALLQADPEERLATLLADASRLVPACEDEAEAMRLLRRMKAEAALLIAIADIGGVWPVMRITRALTDLADTAVGGAVGYLLAEAVRQGKLKPANAKALQEGSGYVVLAMGKMGAFELNYSSDIDLIVLFDPRALALAPDTEPGPLYVRLTKGLVKLLQERTGDGYVFRTDLRLRPDPASTQIALSIDSALSYYESMGQNWERAAMIKARPCAGDIAVGEVFLRNVSPFVWRKYLDYVAVADIHAMKRQIHAYRGHDEIAVAGHNVKLGRGGIREIEFFAQTQQLVAGGRNPVLRGRETLKTLQVLAEGGWIGDDARRDLEAAYLFLRGVEHRLQMVADEQTQTLPEDVEDLERFARFLGYADRDTFSKDLLVHLRKVERHYAKLFEETPAGAPETRKLDFPQDADDTKTLDMLVEMGFRRPVEASAAVRRWLYGDYRSLRGEVARSHMAELVPFVLEQFSPTENPDAAIAAFDRFLTGLHGGARFLSLLRQNPGLLALFALVLGTAPRLADILAQHPQAMDGLIDPSFFGVLPDEEKLAAGLAETLGQASSYEDFLDRVRMFGQEHMFLIGARILSGTVTAEQAGGAFARLADVLLRSLHRAVEDEFARTHGRLRGQQTVVLALGKLGGREMTAGSDLDLIMVYDFDDNFPESDGPRPLHGAQYFARLTQRLVSALSARTNYGALYAVDMRLRPSGRSGPVATKLDAFADYQENEAWTWEHMALTRARVVSGSLELAARVESVIRSVLSRARDAEQVAGDAVEMRAAIAAERGDKERWDLKNVAGGLIDVEFITQYLQLVHAAEQPDILDTSTVRVLDKAYRLGLLTPQDAEVLRPAARLYHNLTQILRLCLDAPFDAKTAGAGLLGLLARAGDVPNFPTLDAHLDEIEKDTRAAFKRILGRTQ